MTTVWSSDPEVTKICADLVERVEESTAREAPKWISLETGRNFSASIKTSAVIQ